MIYKTWRAKLKFCKTLKIDRPVLNPQNLKLPTQTSHAIDLHPAQSSQLHTAQTSQAIAWQNLPKLSDLHNQSEDITQSKWRY